MSDWYIPEKTTRNQCNSYVCFKNTSISLHTVKDEIQTEDYFEYNHITH